MAFLFDKIRNYTVVEDFEHLNCFVRNLENIYCVFRCRSIDNEYTGGQTLVMNLNRLGICQVVAVAFVRINWFDRVSVIETIGVRSFEFLYAVQNID